MTTALARLPVDGQFNGGSLPPSSARRPERQGFDRTLNDADAQIPRLDSVAACQDRPAVQGQSDPEAKPSPNEDGAVAEADVAVAGGIDAGDTNGPGEDADGVSGASTGTLENEDVTLAGAMTVNAFARVAISTEGTEIGGTAVEQRQLQGRQVAGEVRSVASADPLSTSPEPTRLAAFLALGGAEGDGEETPGAAFTVLSTAGGLAPGTAPTDEATGRTAASLLPSGLTHEDAVNVGRVVRGIRTAINQQGGVVTLRLHPPELGFVRIQLEINNGVVRAEFSAEQSSVRNLLTQQMGQLRAALESHGLSVERLVAQTLNNHPSSGSAPGGSDEAPNEGRSRGWTSAGSSDQRPDDERDDPEAPAEEATFASMLNTVG